MEEKTLDRVASQQAEQKLANRNKAGHYTGAEG
jgi:hypothetical protein